MSKAPKRKPAPTFRVNARLDSATHAQLVALEQSTELSTTDVVKEALRRMHAELVGERAPSTDALDRLVGRYAGPRDLSEKTKVTLTASLTKKHRR
ncbi:MAG: hypothetical protein SFX73_04210 [Kofleriaceae bacterium]|nr:hypothetical protein [Kofleriaceae bacterium]